MKWQTYRAICAMLNTPFASIELPGAIFWKTLGTRLSVDSLRQTEMTQVSSFSVRQKRHEHTLCVFMFYEDFP